MTKKRISAMVDSWLCEEDLPTKPGLRVIRKFDDLYPEDWDQDQFQAYWEFIRKGLINDYRLRWTPKIGQYAKREFRSKMDQI